TSYLGVIVYLTTTNELNPLKTSLTQLSRLLSNNPRPVVIFHEGDFDADDIQKSLSNILGNHTPLGFERIRFSNHLIQPRPVGNHRWPLKYTDMCRFFTLMLVNHPLLTLFTYYWRLDAHSYIFGPKPIEDPFEMMQKRQIQYAFIMASEEADYYAVGLWSFFHEFLDNRCLKPSIALRQTQTDLFGNYSLYIIFTNFAIANVSLFRDHSLIRAWLHAVDRNGGIYRYRWGDAPIHTLILTQFLSQNHIVRLRYFGYMHQREYICADGIKGEVCKAQGNVHMTSNTVPIYRQGRKFYVSAEEYERISSEERLIRRTAILKSQQLPVSKSHQTHIRTPSTCSYNPIARNNSNSYDYKYGVVKTRHVPVKSLINTNNQRESNRLSRSILKHYDDQNDLSSITSTISKRKPKTNVRSHSSDKVLDTRKTPLSSNTYNQIKRSLSAENMQAQTLVLRQKLKQQSHSPLRRPILRTVSDYGMSPRTTFSITPSDQTYTQTNTSKLTSYLARIKQSSLNSPSNSSLLANSGTGTLFETSMQGFDNVYTVLGSSNQRSSAVSSSLTTPSITNNSKNEYYHRDTTSGSFSDDNSSTLSTLFQQRNTDKNNNRRSEYVDETGDNHSQQLESWTRSTVCSQSSDGITEKKRVRFADTEGFTLEIIPDKNQLRSMKNDRLLTKRQHMKILNDSHDQNKPFYNAFYQVTTKVGQSKLATDV
ncbi:unnamed protein product, partial [Rotaria sp. Silwood1]